MAIRGQIHHIEIYVTDLEKSAHFWDWLLEWMGYNLYQQWPQGKSWKLGETYLVFVQREDKFAHLNYHRCGTGLNHIAFHGESRQQVDELTRLLQMKGYQILYADRHPYAGGSGYYAVFFEDPDRIKIEFVAPNS